MLILTGVFVLLTFGSCRAERNENSNEKDFKFCVNVKKGTELTTFQEGDPKTYFYEIGDTIELTCRHNPGEGKNSTLQWIDNFEFKTAEHRGLQKAALRVIIEPDIDDNRLALTCQAYEDEDIAKDHIRIVLVLDATDPTDGLKPDTKSIGHSKKDGGPPQTYCDSTTQFRTDIAANVRTHILSTNKTSMFVQKESFNDINCVTYLDLGLNKFGPTDEQVQTYKRLKSKHIFNQDPDSVSSKQNELAQERMKGNKTGSPNTVAVVGGLLGAVLVLMSVILYLWYRKKQRGSPDDAADQVIYTEIEERPSHVLPPRRDQQHYAKIMGTLIPKEQPPLTSLYIDEPLYTEINI